MSDPVVTQLPPRRCPQCGAALNEAARACWLCGVAPSSPIDKPGAMAGPVEEQPQADAWLRHGAVWLAVIVAAVVGYGVLAENVIFGLMYFVAVAPPILITLIVATVSRAAGRPVHPLAKAALGTGIAALSVPLALAAAALAIVVGLFQICTTGQSPLLDFLNR